MMIINVYVCIYICLVGGFNSAENISQLGWLFPIYVKIKNVPNHQADIHYIPLASFCILRGELDHPDFSMVWHIPYCICGKLTRREWNTAHFSENDISTFPKQNRVRSYTSNPSWSAIFLGKNWDFMGSIGEMILR